ncbi:MAG: redoxin domain-containing protein [Chloroflexi bacterium]|nr:redoxin domain-containing protein [Chloroflexota bacterium]
MVPAPEARIPQIGEPAPDFTLPFAPRETVTLSQYRGQKHVVLAFYVMDWTGG